MTKCFFIEDTGRTRERIIRAGEWGPGGVCYEPIYRRPDTGEEKTLSEWEPGAMWYADWLDSTFTPQLDHVLIVKLPNRDEWVIDAQCSNCTMKGDIWQREHHCWVIEGQNLPKISVGKNGKTCSAGAGSIMSGDYHGFLRDGNLT